jgi:hypothetical protein
MSIIDISYTAAVQFRHGLGSLDQSTLVIALAIFVEEADSLRFDLGNELDCALAAFPFAFHSTW